MSKYTPGPWKAQGNLIFSAEHVHVAKLFAPPRETGQSVAHIEAANARLIAAAPELLEACKKAKAHLDAYEISGEGNPCLAIEFLAIAIAKASGIS